jgi:hypothetical protein
LVDLIDSLLPCFYCPLHALRHSISFLRHQQDQFSEGKAICYEIGAAVLTALGEKREFTIQTLVNVMQASRENGVENKRIGTIKLAENILNRFS